MLPYAMATKDTLTHYLPRLEVHSTIMQFPLFIFLLPFLLIWVIGVIQQSSFWWTDAASAGDLEEVY